MADKAVTLCVFCAHCAGAVTIECDAGQPDQDGRAQEWFCPHCAATHHGLFPGLLAWVMKGHDDTIS